MKKLVAMLLVFTMSISLAACGVNKSSESTSGESKANESTVGDTKATFDLAGRYTLEGNR